jgi:hypothetical protein
MLPADLTVLVMWSLHAVTVPQAAAAQDQHGPVDQFLNRVLALSSYQNVSTLSTEDKLRNLRQLEELGREVERELRPVNVEL